MKFSRNNLYIFYLFLLVIALSGSAVLNSCKTKTDSNYKLTGNVIADGEAIVQLKCSGCHQVVPVNELSKSVWINHTLPSMAKYLHVGVYAGDQYYKVNPLDTSGISLPAWQALVAYYQKAAPDSLPAAKPPVAAVNDWGGFTLKKPAEVPIQVFTSMIGFDPVASEIITSDASTERLYKWDASLKPHAIADMPSPVVSVNFVKGNDGKQEGIFSCIGQLEPIDFPNGRVVGIDVAAAQPAQSTLASELARPVQTVSGDFNKDGLNDLVVCSQGFKTGGVYLLTQKPDHSYNQTTVTEQPGAVQALAGDFNNDGWPDLMVLYGSANEGLWLYTNNQKGGFTAKNLMQFPPVYGSTSFQLVDLDHDGKLDLIYTCGYNFHDSRIMKPYNGLYIFKNMGDWSFKQQWFYPINGCTKAIAADFKGNGSTGIATSAFFGNFKNNPAEGVMYFEQDKPFTFKPHLIPVSQYGRWMCMDVADYNKDGKPDILLGNYSAGFSIFKDFTSTWNKKLPFIVLENNFKK